MSNKAVFTICVGETYEAIGEITHPSIKKYAEKIGVDFIIINKSVCSTPHWDKLLTIERLFEEYDRLMYIDTDIIIRDDTPDVFELFPEDKLCMFDEAKYTMRGEDLLWKTCTEYDTKIDFWDGCYYNTGVMIIPKKYSSLFKKPEKENCCFYEQTYLNMIFAKENPEIYKLPYQYNRMTCLDVFTGEPRYAAYFIHYAGCPNPKTLLPLIRNDLIRWLEDTPEYKYKRNILINVTGGIGDQICAEPAVRFMRKHIYPTDNITVKTHWPELFQHLSVEVYKHSEFRPKMDTPYFNVTSLPEPNTLLWSCVSNLLSHTVDFCSMALLKRILPNADKQIMFSEVKSTEIEKVKKKLHQDNLTDMVTVHPGRHWPSKTFPVSWWQGVVDGLIEAGLRVCIIGKNDDTRGIVDLNMNNVIDAVNKLNLRELIVLISQAKILISNDSAPIHIAGAFDNHIILIPTCKHHDHILPYRNGSMAYKTHVLYKKLMTYEYESAPTHVCGSSADYVPGEWKDFLPDISEVIDKIKQLI